MAIRCASSRHALTGEDSERLPATYQRISFGRLFGGRVTMILTLMPRCNVDQWPRGDCFQVINWLGLSLPRIVPAQYKWTQDAACKKGYPPRSHGCDNQQQRGSGSSQRVSIQEFHLQCSSINCQAKLISSALQRASSRSSGHRCATWSGW